MGNRRKGLAGQRARERFYDGINLSYRCLLPKVALLLFFLFARGEGEARAVIYS